MTRVSSYLLFIVLVGFIVPIVFNSSVLMIYTMDEFDIYPENVQTINFMTFYIQTQRDSHFTHHINRNENPNQKKNTNGRVEIYRKE